MLTYLVLGGAGHGKSTLIRCLGGINTYGDYEKPRTGLEADNAGEDDTQGVTKTADFYECNLTEFDQRVSLMDSVGFGDGTVPVAESIAQIEETAKHCNITGIICVQSVLDERVSLPTQLVQTVAKLDFKAPDGSFPWERVIYCGTKADMAKPRQLDKFLRSGQHFFEKSYAWTTNTVTVGADPEHGYCADGYKPLIDRMVAVAKLSGHMEVQPANSKELGDAIAAKVGGDPEQISNALQVSRDKLQAEFQAASLQFGKSAVDGFIGTSIGKFTRDQPVVKGECPVFLGPGTYHWQDDIPEADVAEAKRLEAEWISKNTTFEKVKVVDDLAKKGFDQAVASTVSGLAGQAGTCVGNMACGYAGVKPGTLKREVLSGLSGVATAAAAGAVLGSRAGKEGAAFGALIGGSKECVNFAMKLVAHVLQGHSKSPG